MNEKWRNREFFLKDVVPESIICGVSWFVFRFLFFHNHKNGGSKSPTPIRINTVFLHLFVGSQAHVWE